MVTAEPFTEAWISAEVPLMTVKTFYTTHGDFLGKAFSWMAFFLLLFSAASCIISYGKRRLPKK
jgi:hypothetical protein